MMDKLWDNKNIQKYLKPDVWNQDSCKHIDDWWIKGKEGRKEGGKDESQHPPFQIQIPQSLDDLKVENPMC